MTLNKIYKSERCFDSDGFKKRAACVCVKRGHDNKVLLISSRHKPNCWIVPGGGIELNENAEAAAIREALEEAGVKGTIRRLLGVFENKEQMNRTIVFEFEVNCELDVWEESKNIGRKRKWFNIEDAKLELEKHKPIQSLYLEKLESSKS